MAAPIYSEGPLGHIQTGNALLLNVPNYSPRVGYQLEIRHVEVYVSAPVDAAAPERVQVNVFCCERDRAAILKQLK